MKILVAIDSFKGSLSSLQAGEAVKSGILKAAPSADVQVSPVADGGEGTVEALVYGMGGHLRSVTVTGPTGNPVTAQYGILPMDGTAIIEMAAAAGLPLVPKADRNPFFTTTRGVGELICDAISQKCRRFLIGIGGSASNDGGLGMLQALGFDFLDSDGTSVPLGAIGLSVLSEISTIQVLPELKDCQIRIACDVNNPLCGEHGCSTVFGPQKGATPEMVIEMDSWLCRFAELTKRHFPNSDPDYPGSGAAGGLGFAFMSFLNASLEPGIRIILEETQLENKIQTADLIVTGEGRLDAQTMMGKAPSGVAALAKKHSKPVLAFAGSVSPEASVCNIPGIDAFFPILRNICTLEEAMQPEVAAQNLSDAAEQVFRLINVLQKL